MSIYTRRFHLKSPDTQEQNPVGRFRKSILVNSLPGNTGPGCYVGNEWHNRLDGALPNPQPLTAPEIRGYNRAVV